MSSFYTLDHVIQECLREKANVLNTARGKNLDSKVEIYRCSWSALNTWIESRLKHHKGASVSGFASFCWEMLEKNGETHCRPLFLVADSFVKTFRVRRPRIHNIPQLTPIEEVNFSLLAIKYSKNLTKDMMFSGIRDIVRKIGEFIFRGYEMQIDFTFGTLHAKESRVKFVFNQHRLIEILPENSQPGVYATTDAPMKYIIENTSSNNTQEEEYEDPEYFDPSQSTTRQTSTAPLKRPSTSSSPRILTDRPFTERYGMKKTPSIPSLNLSQKKPVPSLPSASTMSPELASSTLFGNTAGIAASDTSFNSFNQTQQSESASLSSTASAPSPDVKAILDAIGNRSLKVGKDEWRNQAKARVIQQAFDRCLEDAEKEAQFLEHRSFEAKKQFDDWRSTMRQKTLKGKEDMEDLKKTLDQQVQQFHTRQNQEKMEFKNSVSKNILPDTAGVAPTSTAIDENGRVINSRQLVAKHLEKQIVANAAAKEKEKREAMMKERDFLEKLALESEFEKIMERSSHLEKQKALLEAWEKDCHVRNVKKLQSHGPNLVKDYIQRNLADIDATSGFTRTLGQQLNMSIGYDPRTGKLPN